MSTVIGSDSTKTGGQRLQGVFLIALSAAGFGAMAIFARVAYAGGADVGGALLLRFAIAALVLLVIVQIRQLPWPDPATLAKLAAMGGIGYVGMSWCYFAALNYVPASLVALLLYTYPTIVTLLAAIFLRERITRRKLGALLVCGLGTVLTIGPNLLQNFTVNPAQAGGVSLIGVGFGLAAALIYAVYIVAGAKVTRSTDPIMTATVVCIAATVVLSLLALLGAGNGAPPHFPTSAAGWAGVAGVALVSTVMAVMAFFAGLKRLGASLASMLSTLEPVVTVALAGWLLGESLVGWQWLGGALTLSGVLWLAAPPKNAALPQEPAPAPIIRSPEI